MPALWLNALPRIFEKITQSPRPVQGIGNYLVKAHKIHAEYILAQRDYTRVTSVTIV
jgi:hypothetical protein